MKSSLAKNLDASSLYQKDFYQWLQNTGNLIKSSQFNQIDYENLLEEIEAMGRNEKHKLESNLIVILMHLLKYKYQPEKRSKSWLSSIFEHRRRLIRQLEDSPSLKGYYLKILQSSYQYARKQASIETGLSLRTFPETNPFTPENTLDFDYLPN
jgi:hypothetical protein